jgi:hypothetical protein
LPPPFNPKADDDVAKTVNKASGAIFMVVRLLGC